MSPENFIQPLNPAETNSRTFTHIFPINTAETTLVTLTEPFPTSTAETTSKTDYLTTKERTVVTTLEKKLKEEFGKEATGHDWEHLDRVRNTAVSIAKKILGVNIFIVEVSALLHDWKDPKIKGHESRPSVKQLLTSLDNTLDEETINTINDITENIGYSKKNKKPWTNIEGKIAEDADRLDAIGAIGIARTFAYGGAKQESYATTLAYFDHKLVKLRDLMNTHEGKEIANRRHEFMVEFLALFSAEQTELASSYKELQKDFYPLHSLGATGIANAFTYAGNIRVPMHNGEKTTRESMALKVLHNPKGIKLGQERLHYMGVYSRQLTAEKQGQK